MSEDKLPSKVEMGLNILKAGAKAVSHIIKEKEVPLTKEELQKLRLDICKSCPFVIKPKKKNKGKHRCSKCGCYLEMKTRVKTEKCPKGKW